MDAICKEGLTKRYGRARGIEGVSLAVARGDVFGFIGPNGAGKSTTIRALLGLVRPSAGRGQIFGLDIGKDRERILARVGYLPAEATFWPGMRVREVLRLSADLRRRRCGKAAEALCERLRLDPSRRVEELSFGDRKKAAIVCAMQHEPELLILDEPTGGLDPLMQRAFFAILRERNQAGATVFLSSHILSEIQHNCSRAAIIREGRIIASGSVEELSRTGTKRIAVRGTMDCGGLSGVRDLHISPGSMDFLYGGSMKSLLRAAAAGDIRDITITEPDLEEVFLHYYGKGGGGA